MRINDNIHNTQSCYRETVMLDPTLIWKESETTENMQIYANDFASLKGREREDVLLKYYNETAHAKAMAVGYYFEFEAYID